MASNGVAGDAVFLLKECAALSDQMGVFVLGGKLLLFPVVERGNIGVGIPFRGVAVFVALEGGELCHGCILIVSFIDFDGAGRSFFAGDPSGEVLFVQSNDAEAHDSVGFAAIFGALSPEVAGLVGLQPEVVAAVGDHVDLASEFGHPEGVDDVDGAEIDADGTTGGDHELVGGD